MDLVILDTSDKLINELNSLPNSFIFRGHSDANWKLESTLERMIGCKWDKDIADKHEKYSMQVFKSKFHLYDHENVVPKSKLAWLSIMQHYGVPTRLLDFTESPYVALYFALEGYGINKNSDLAIFALNHSQLMIESLNYIASKDAGFKEDVYTIVEKQDDVFESIVDRFSYDIAWITEPHELNIRLDRQSGCFLMSGNKEKKIEDVLSGNIYNKCTFTKYIIKSSLHGNLYALLRKMNINSKTIYGDLQGLAQSIKMDMIVHT